MPFPKSFFVLFFNFGSRIKGVASERSIPFELLLDRRVKCERGKVLLLHLYAHTAVVERN